MQLICYYVLGIVSLAAFFQDPDKAGHIFYATLLLFFTVGGVVFAARQLWMQHLPANQIIPCGPNLTFMMANFSLSGVIDTIFNRTDSCSMVNWSFMDLSMAAWSLIFYMVIGISTVFSLVFYRSAEHASFKLQTA
jgi:disulfide bond formation protein DsbB